MNRYASRDLKSRIPNSRCLPVLVALVAFCGLAAAQSVDSTSSASGVLPVIGPTPRANAERLIRTALQSRTGYTRLQELCDTFGPRHTSSTNLAAAIQWAQQTMTRDGFVKVRGEEVRVPRWVRGAESIALLEPRFEVLPMLGLGGSVGTPPDGLTAPVLVVTNLEHLAARAASARGKIVLFATPYTSYGQVVAIRSRGAVEVARAGGVASLIRSLTPYSLRSPHTGVLRYDPAVPKIPAAALATEDADMLQRMQDRGQQPVLRIKMEAQAKGEITTHNVIAEIPGQTHPEEIVLVSGHFDSWDVGQGAQDDAAGCLAAWEAARLMIELGLRPRRTIRVVLWVDEEATGRGARAYVEAHRDELARHVLAIESDTGIYRPLGFRFTGSEAAAATMRAILGMLEPVGATRLTLGGADADIAKLMAEGVPAASLAVDGQRYFWFHHSLADTVDKVDSADLQRCTAALAVLSYLAADLPEALPR